MSYDSRHPERKSLGWLLTQAARAHRNRLGTRLASLGLVAGQEQVLQALQNSGPVSMGVLAELLRVKPPTVSKTVSRLAGLGLIERLQTREGDNRVIRVALTVDGLEKAKQVDVLWNETEDELLTGFDAKERRRLRKLLRRVIRSFSASGNETDPEGSQPDEVEE